MKLLHVRRRYAREIIARSTGGAHIAARDLRRRAWPAENRHLVSISCRHGGITYSIVEASDERKLKKFFKWRVSMSAASSASAHGGVVRGYRHQRRRLVRRAAAPASGGTV